MTSGLHVTQQSPGSREIHLS